MNEVLEVTGEALTLDDLARVARDPRVEVRPSAAALARVAAGRRQIERIGEQYRAAYAAWQAGGPAPTYDYGITTGFGEFKNIPIHPDELEQLQRNILLSHAVGVGETTRRDDPGNYFPAEVVRAVLLIRINAFLRGHSGVRAEMVECVAAMLNRGIVPLVPVRGSLGSSGDLCPLAHLFVVLLGEGRYYVVREPGDLGAPAAALQPAGDLAGDLGRAPLAPGLKEGLALTNGATFSAAMLALAVVDGEIAANAADVGAALSLEAACGCARALDAAIHQARGMPGQIASAENLRRLVGGSRLVEKAGAVQDVYSLRCAPQVHGASRDAIAYARMVTEREVNAATDNPLFFPDRQESPFDVEFSDNWPAGYSGGERASYSAGNFHGQPLALAADFLAIALAELADISERRTQMLLDAHHSRNLPGNLVPLRGVNSGFMIVQYCAASMVSENKVLTHPASVDSIPTSANTEDHVAMAAHGARKLRSVLHNVESVLAIELMVAAAAIDWRVGLELEPGNAGRAAPPRDDVGFLQRARDEAEAFARAVAAECRPAIAGHLGRGTGAAYLAVRGVCEPLLRDRPLDGDILEVHRLLAYRGELRGSALLAAVGEKLDAPLRSIPAMVVPAT